MNPALKAVFQRGGKQALLGDLYLETETLHWTNWGEPLRYSDPVTGNSAVYAFAPFTLADSTITKDPQETSVITIHLQVLGHGDENLSTSQAASLQEAMAQLDTYLERHEIRGALAILRLVNPEDLTGDLHLFTGIVDTCQVDEGGLTLEIADALENLPAPAYPIAAACPYLFGDSRCGVDRDAAANRYAGTAQAGSTDDTIVDSGISPATAGYWAIAVIRITSGVNEGLTREVRTYDHATGTLTVAIPFDEEMQAGDTYELRRRCKKTFAHCQVLNADPTRFGGCPYVNEPIQGLYWRGKG